MKAKIVSAFLFVFNLKLFTPYNAINLNLNKKENLVQGKKNHACRKLEAGDASGVRADLFD